MFPEMELSMPPHVASLPHGYSVQREYHMDTLFCIFMAFSYVAVKD